MAADGDLVSRVHENSVPKSPADVQDGAVCLSISGSEVVHEEGENLKSGEGSFGSISVLFLQKLIAEMVGTYFLVFGGCAAIVANSNQDKVVSLLGIALAWGLLLVAIIYSIGHISGAHVNPAVTIAFATCDRFPWKQVPAYVLAQVLGSTVASGTLRLVLGDLKVGQIPVNAPVGSDLQSLVIEFIVTFFLMFVICGVATDERATTELAGLAIGVTVAANILYAGPISSASMNPARSLGTAFIWNRYKGIWIYILGPTCGCIAGAWAYNIIRPTPNQLQNLTTVPAAAARSSFFEK